jgi:hypothetical protein
VTAQGYFPAHLAAFMGQGPVLEALKSLGLVLIGEEACSSQVICAAMTPNQILFQVAYLYRMWLWGRGTGDRAPGCRRGLGQRLDTDHVA